VLSTETIEPRVTAFAFTVLNKLLFHGLFGLYMGRVLGRLPGASFGQLLGADSHNFPPPYRPFSLIRALILIYFTNTPPLHLSDLL